VSRAQRLTFLAIAVVIAIVAVVVLTSGGDDEPETTSATATPTATATDTAAPEETATATPTPKPTPEVPVVTTTGDVTDLEFKQGDTVRFRVRSTVSDEIHVHGYDLMKDVTPGETVTFSFPASITGIFEIELENAGEQIAQLRVDP
jgi:hypothetical protein